MSLPELTLTEGAAVEFAAVIDVFSAATNPAAGSSPDYQLGDGAPASTGVGGFAASIGAAIGSAFSGGPSAGEGGPE